MRVGTHLVWAVAGVAVALMLGGCSGQTAGADIEIAVRGNGAVEERVTVRGVESVPEVSGWSAEGESSKEYVASFDDSSDLPGAEAALLGAVVRAASEELGYEPSVLGESSIDVTVEDYLLFKAIEVSYRPPEVDFRPPHCLECEGAGRHDCEACGTEGSLTCPSCDGEGAIGCGDCGGEGSSTCEECSGAGDFACTSCDSRGWSECYGCDGQGVDSWGDSCWWCDGTGRDECGSCDGDGREDCWSCDSTGRIECWTCGAEGQLECDECGGLTSVTCAQCEGYGALTCEPCNGIGAPTSADLAAYDSALEAARINVTIDMPGFTAEDADTSWTLRGADTLLPDEMQASSRVPDWPVVLGSGGALLALGMLGVVLSARGIRARRRQADGIPAQSSEMVTPPAAPEQPACAQCGAQLRETSAFCTECGARR